MPGSGADLVGVAVCPTGIDIRNGSQLDCIQCGLCIDACDAVMTKIGRETRLIGYDNPGTRAMLRAAVNTPHAILEPDRPSGGSGSPRSTRPPAPSLADLGISLAS